jgi:hypothetical protein
MMSFSLTNIAFLPASLAFLNSGYSPCGSSLFPQGIAHLLPTLCPSISLHCDVFVHCPESSYILRQWVAVLSFLTSVYQAYAIFTLTLASLISNFSSNSPCIRLVVSLSLLAFGQVIKN